MRASLSVPVVTCNGLRNVRWINTLVVDRSHLQHRLELIKSPHRATEVLLPVTTAVINVSNRKLTCLRTLRLLHNSVYPRRRVTRINGLGR